jgi:hypothetical protein
MALRSTHFTKLWVFTLLVKNCIARNSENVVLRRNLLKKLKPLCSKELCPKYVYKSLYSAFVRPIIEHASVVWSPSCQFHIHRIQSVQRRFLLRALSGIRWSSPLILPAYENWLQLITACALYLTYCQGGSMHLNYWLRYQFMHHHGSWGFQNFWDYQHTGLTTDLSHH